MPRQQTLLLIALFASWIPSFGIAASSEDATQFFENRIRPLLAERCYECHNEDLQESGLRLDSLQAMIDGGERGPAIVPGNAKDSLLIHAVNHSEADLQMPEGDKLSAREIADLATWIREGAIWPGQQAEIRKSAEQDGPLLPTPNETSGPSCLPGLTLFRTYRIAIGLSPNSTISFLLSSKLLVWNQLLQRPSDHCFAGRTST